MAGVRRGKVPRGGLGDEEIRSHVDTRLETLPPDVSTLIPTGGFETSVRREDWCGSTVRRGGGPIQPTVGRLSFGVL